jgi:hypothetical protein
MTGDSGSTHPRLTCGLRVQVRHGYGYGYAQKYPRVTHADPYWSPHPLAPCALVRGMVTTTTPQAAPVSQKASHRSPLWNRGSEFGRIGVPNGHDTAVNAHPSCHVIPSLSAINHGIIHHICALLAYSYRQETRLLLHAIEI